MGKEPTGQNKEGVKMRKALLALLVVAVFCVPNYALAKMVKVEGTVEGLMSMCDQKMCTPGEETLIAAMEDTYVLVPKPGEYYLLPNVKSSILSRYLGQTVRVEGEPKLDGRAIMVKTAEVKIDQNWLPFYSPDILQMRQAREKGAMGVP
jgi:hypothetical protein